MADVEDASEEEYSRWVPPMAQSFYRVEIGLEGLPAIQLSATVPAGFESIELSSAVVQRIGGASSRDWAFRRELYFYVGLVTVASGKIEAAMKRAIMLGRGDSHAAMVSVDQNWTQLAQELRTVAQVQTSAPTVADGWGEAVTQTLDWGETERAKKLRDDVVHAYWWDWADTSAHRSRFYRRGESVHMAGSLEDLRRDGETLLTFADMLEQLSGPRWLNLYLPREVPEGEEQANGWEWAERHPPQ